MPDSEELSSLSDDMKKALTKASYTYEKGDHVDYIRIEDLGEPGSFLIDHSKSRVPAFDAMGIPQLPEETRESKGYKLLADDNIIKGWNKEPEEEPVGLGTAGLAVAADATTKGGRLLVDVLKDDLGIQIQGLSADKFPHGGKWASGM